jgi:parallel beta-helix repeat protein
VDAALQARLGETGMTAHAVRRQVRAADRLRRVRARLLSTAAAILLAAGVLMFGAPSASAAPLACGTVVTTSIVLDADIIDCGTEGLVVGADGITIDLNGHIIDGTVGDDSAGVRNPGFDDVTIRNGTIQEFERGISLEAAARQNVVGEVTAAHNGSGFAIDASSGNLLAGNQTLLNGTGIFLLRNASRNTIRNNSIDDTFTGMLIGGSANRVERNRVYANGVGIEVDGPGGGNRVADNLISGGCFGQLRVLDSNRNVLETNEITHGCGTAIQLVRADSNRIERNLAGSIGSDGNQAGIELLEGSDDNIVRRNTTAQNATDGIFVESGSLRTRVERNVASFNSDDGIDVDDPTTTIAGNDADFNLDLGIEAVAGVNDGGRNTATGNGDPAQCLNVVCTSRR